MDWQAALRARLISAPFAVTFDQEETFNQGEVFIGNPGPLAAGITALVGTRVYWVDRPQASDLPAITLQTISDARPQYMEGFMDLHPARIQIDTWSTKHAEANSLAELIIAALAPAYDGEGVEFSRAFLDDAGKRDLGERLETLFVHHVSFDLIIHHATA